MPTPKPDDVLFLLRRKGLSKHEVLSRQLRLLTEATVVFLPWDLTPRDLAQHELVNTVILSSP